MSSETAQTLAQVVLAVHLAAASFIVFGLVAIPLGARLGWAFVYGSWWRLAHLITMSAIALQKQLGNSCFLSQWESRLMELAQRASHMTPLFQAVGDRILYIDLPLWFFTGLYTMLWVYVIALWFVVPPRRWQRAR